jgi:glycosyltransferase involved in cell wall biosynthesis
MLKISVFSTSDIDGGAARASARLSYGLLKNNEVSVAYYVKSKKEDIDTTKLLIKKDNIYEDIELLIQRNYINTNRTDLTNTLFSFSYSDIKLPKLDSCDVINIHWIEKFLSIHNLYELTKLNKPIVWTLHDMKPFTGGCHYSAGCDSFINNCKVCPQLIDDSCSLTSKVLDMKREIFENSNITIVTPSVWLGEEVGKSTVFKNKRVEVIPNGVDSTIFKPMDKKLAKNYLGIDENSIVLTFGVMSHAEKRKGFDELIESIKLLKNKITDKNVIALFFGTALNQNFPIPSINIGRIDDDKKLSIVYSAADIFILPSLEDNLPNTILESLSCQTPIVAFDTGGAKDIINDDNGKIVPKGDIKALSDEIYNLIIDKNQREKKGKNGRELILLKYQLQHQADAYIELFKELKNEKFNYIEKKIDVNTIFDSLIGSSIRKHQSADKLLLEFSRNYNKIYTQIIKLKESNLSFVIYGNGTVSKTIQALIPKQIVGYVDMAEKDNHPKKLLNMKFDKIIISVLGREDSIIKYLVDELEVSKDKIVTFEL